MEVRLWNMHGPTAYAIDNWDDLPKLLKDWDRTCHSNAGYYRIIATVNGISFEILPGVMRESDWNPERPVFHLTNPDRNGYTNPSENPFYPQGTDW